MKKELFLAASIGLVSLSVNAEEGVPAIADDIVKKECGACHMAFQPQFLPADSWRKIMQGLQDHFGEDASLDEETTRHIGDYLASHAGRSRGSKPVTRITELGWFVQEHSDEVSSAAKKRAGSMANCVACHRGADKGIFED